MIMAAGVLVASAASYCFDDGHAFVHFGRQSLIGGGGYQVVVVTLLFG